VRGMPDRSGDGQLWLLPTIAPREQKDFLAFLKAGNPAMFTEKRQRFISLMAGLEAFCIHLSDLIDLLKEDEWPYFGMVYLYMMARFVGHRMTAVGLERDPDDLDWAAELRTSPFASATGDIGPEQLGSANDRVSHFWQVTSKFVAGLRLETIVAGTLSHGQGHETSYAQMVADWLGVPEDKIHLAQADTDEVAIGRGTYASRSMMIGGSALRAAADQVIARGKRFAAHTASIQPAERIEIVVQMLSGSNNRKSIHADELAEALLNSVPYLKISPLVESWRGPEINTGLRIEMSPDKLDDVARCIDKWRGHKLAITIKFASSDDSKSIIVDNLAANLTQLLKSLT
jgi:hypothetical protein